MPESPGYYPDDTLKDEDLSEADPYKNIFFQVNSGADTRRLSMAHGRLKKLRDQLAPEIQEELNYIMEELNLPSEHALAVPDVILKGSLQRMGVARKQLLDLKNKVDPSLHHEIDTIVAEIR